MRTTLNAVMSVLGYPALRRTEQIIEALEVRLERAHAATLYHGQRLEAPVRLTCLSLGLPPEHAASAGRAAILHDVGKVEISPEILDKPGKLTDDEYTQIKRHSEIGAGILMGAGLHRWSLWVRHHHERWAGGGYPLGISGDRIPLESRVIAVADAFDAMAAGGDNARPYRKPLSAEEALEEIHRCAGSQFDPHVVEAFCRVGVC